MADNNPKRDDKQEDGIVSLKSRIGIEMQELPAYKRIMRKFKIWIAVSLVAILLSIATSTTFFLFYLIISALVIYIWLKPDNDQLKKWRKERLAQK
jgi:hypothetical protein